MQNLALNQFGALKNVPITQKNALGGNQTSTSRGSAKIYSTNPTDPSYGMRQTTPVQGGLIPQQPTIQHPTVTPTSNAAIKSQTTSSDGTVKTDYHAPTVIAPDDPTNKYNTSTGKLNTNYKDPNAPTIKTTPSPTQNQNPPQQSYSQSPSYPGLINTLANQGNSPYNQAAKGYISALGTQTGENQTYSDRAKSIADAAGQRISDIGGQGARGEAGYLTTGTSPVGEGNAAILAQTTAAQQQAVAAGANMELAGNAQGLTAQQQAQSGYNNAAGQALTGQGQEQGAISNAAGYASPSNTNYSVSPGNIAYNAITGQYMTAPTQVPYNNQYINPLTGQAINGGGGGVLPPEAQQAVSSYAEQVRNGSMTRSDAESRLSAYGIAGSNALNQALGTGFNTNASNASAQTTAVGQQVKTAADSTNQALDTLSNLFSGLPGWSTGGIPVTNELANWIGTKVGSPALSQYKTNLADARSQLIGVLNSSGGTPTGNEATANQYLPDNMTKQQFEQNVGTAQNPGIVRKLIAQKVAAFTQSGQQNSGTGGTGLFSW